MDRFELLPGFLGTGEFLRTRLSRVIGQPVVKAMIAKLSGIFRMRLEHSLDVIMRGLFELLVLWCGGRGNARQCESERDRGCKIFCGDHLMSACPHLKPPCGRGGGV